MSDDLPEFTVSTPEPAAQNLPPGAAPGKVLSQAARDALASAGVPDPDNAAAIAFANHELQAMELFALALLRFPTAPAAWRLELAHVLVEEQERVIADKAARLCFYQEMDGILTSSPQLLRSWSACSFLALLFLFF